MTLKYIIYLNFVIAISAGLLTAGVCNLFDISSYSDYAFFGFFSTLFVYNGQRLFKARTKVRTPWLEWVIQHRQLVFIVTVMSGLIACFYFFKLLNKPTFLIYVLVIVGIVISYLYVVQIKGKSLRELPYIKIHLIALTWTLIIVLFPLINENIYHKEVLKLFIPAHYLYFLAIAIPFDIRDLKYDSPTQKTIPQVFGVKKARLISIFLLIISAIILGFIFTYQLLIPLFFIVILIQLLLILFTTERRNEIYYSFFIDGGIAFLGISYLFA